MTIIALTGYGQSGKDTAGDILVRRGYTRLGMGDVLRDACVALDPIITPRGHTRYSEALEDFGYEEAKRHYPEFRSFMERLGTEFAEAIGYPELWIETLLRGHDASEKIVMTSCRRKCEARAVESRGGAVWRIERPFRGPISDHPVETEMDDWAFDCVIPNDGTIEDLESLVTIASLTVESRARLANLTDRQLRRVDL